MLEITSSLLIMLGLSLAIVMGFMILLWGVYLFTNRVSVVDIGWGVGFILATLVYFSLGEGYVWRRVLVLLLVSCWAFRLIGYLLGKIAIMEDPRYQTLITPESKHPHLRVLSFALLQGFLVVVLSLPFALMSQNSLPFFSTTEVFGVLIWGIGVLGETVADNQLFRFKQDPANQHQVLQSGLWRYSRHPNYFFEWIVWIGYFLMAVSSPAGWLAISAPAIMLYLLLCVSGIPLAEAQALKTKGDAYRDYQHKTSVFFPWFKWK